MRRWGGRRIAILPAHAVENLLGRDNGSALARAGADVAHHVAAGDGAPGLRQFLVPAGMIAMHVRVDDVADRLVGHGPDRCQNLVAYPRVHRVHQQHTLFAHLHGDVAARADKHINVALDRQHVDLDVVEILVLLRKAGRRAASTARIARNTPMCFAHGRLCWRGRCSRLHRRLHRLHFQPVLRVHRFRAAARRLGGQSKALRKLGEKSVFSRQMARHRPFRAESLRRPPRRGKARSAAARQTRSRSSARKVR